MITLFPENRPEAEAVLIRLLPQASPWRKLEMVDQLNLSVKLLGLIGLQQKYPDECEEQLHRWLAYCWVMNWRERFMARFQSISGRVTRRCKCYDVRCRCF